MLIQSLRCASHCLERITDTDSFQDSTVRETSEKDHLAEENLRHRKMTSLAHGCQVYQWGLYKWEGCGV